MNATFNTRACGWRWPPHPRRGRSSTSGATPVATAGSGRMPPSTGCSVNGSSSSTRQPPVEVSRAGRSPPTAPSPLILLDQFPRNAFRGTPRMRDRLIGSRHRGRGDRRRARPLRGTGVAALLLSAFRPFGGPRRPGAGREADRKISSPPSHAEGHRDIVRRFGRFASQRTSRRAMTEAGSSPRCGRVRRPKGRLRPIA